MLIPLMTASPAVYSQLHTLSVIGVGTTAAQLTHFTQESKHKPEEQHIQTRIVEMYFKNLSCYYFYTAKVQIFRILRFQVLEI